MNKPFKIGVISTTFYKACHSDVILTRWTTPRPADPQWGWDGPSSVLAGMYMVQVSERDLGIDWAKDNNIPMFDSVEGALTLGTGEIAVDGVLFVGEHGKYPLNELGQKEYPRKEIFDQIVAVFKKYGKTLPVFNDKHYSYRSDWAHEMHQTAREMGFKLIGGSSIPHTPRVPDERPPRGFKAKKAVAAYQGGSEAYLYHGIDLAQSILEKRAGGEAGITKVTAYQGPEVWKIISEQFGDDLLAASLVPPSSVMPGDMVENCANWSTEDKEETNLSPLLTIVEHADGLQVAYVNLNGHFKSWSLAVQTEDGKTYAAQSSGIGPEVWYAHFATLARLIEDFLMSQEYPFAPERTLLATCATDASMHAMAQPGVPYVSPLTQVAYQPLAADKKYHPGLK